MLDLLVETSMLGYKLANTTMFQNHGLEGRLNQVPIDRERYQKLMRKMM